MKKRAKTVADSVSEPVHRVGAPTRLAQSVLERVNRREPEALGQLFDAHFDRLYSLAFRLLGDRAAAEDVTQELFLKVHRAAHQLDPARDPGPWLTTIMYNACREHWRRSGRGVEAHSRSLDDDTGLQERVSDGLPNPEQAALSGEREQHVQSALMVLPELVRSAVVLHDLHGMTHQEIADLLQSDVAAIRKRYSRGLARLRELFNVGFDEPR